MNTNGKNNLISDNNAVALNDLLSKGGGPPLAAVEDSSVFRRKTSELCSLEADIYNKLL